MFRLNNPNVVEYLPGVETCHKWDMANNVFPDNIYYNRITSVVGRSGPITKANGSKGRWRSTEIGMPGLGSFCLSLIYDGKGSLLYGMSDANMIPAHWRAAFMGMDREDERDGARFNPEYARATINRLLLTIEAAAFMCLDRMVARQPEGSPEWDYLSGMWFTIRGVPVGLAATGHDLRDPVSYC